MKTVLILGSGTQASIISEDIVSDGYRVVMIVHDRHNYGDDSKYVSKLYTTEAPFLSEEYLAFVSNVIQSEKVSVLIPMNDEEAEFVSKYKAQLENVVNIKMPDLETFYNGYNKENLMHLCAKGNYPHPFTLTGIKDITQVDKSKLRFPLLIKPNITCGARGMTMVETYKELLEKYPLITAQYGECHLQQFIKPGGRQVEFQLYVDEKRQLVASSVISKFRWYPEKGGSSCCAESSSNDKMVDILYRLLLDLGWIGFADFDTIEDPDTHELLIMELNPRVPACIKSAVVSGIRWGKIIVDGYLGNQQQAYTLKQGNLLRHIGFEMLWFMYSPNRFKTKPNWFNFFGKGLYFQDFCWKDPKPFIFGTWSNIKKQLNPNFRKSKGGLR